MTVKDDLQEEYRRGDWWLAFKHALEEIDALKAERDRLNEKIADMIDITEATNACRNREQERAESVESKLVYERKLLTKALDRIIVLKAASEQARRALEEIASGRDTREETLIARRALAALTASGPGKT